MKHVLKFAVLIFIISNFISCSKNNSNQASGNSITMIPSTEITKFISPTIALTQTPVPSITQKPTDIPEDLPKPTENTNLNEYQLCGLKLMATEDDIIDNLGNKYGRIYDAYDACAWAELRCHMLYEGITVTTKRSLRINDNDIEGEDLLSEIDVYSPEYTTNRGIKVGDSLDDVLETYHMNGYYEFNNYSEKHNMICTMLSERMNHDDRYVNYNYEFDYGEFEKVAYIYMLDEENPNRRPSLIFLFHGDIVTHIILYNWMYEVV